MAAQHSTVYGLIIFSRLAPRLLLFERCISYSYTEIFKHSKNYAIQLILFSNQGIMMNYDVLFFKSK